jgi:hypothetical protein
MNFYRFSKLADLNWGCTDIVVEKTLERKEDLQLDPWSVWTEEPNHGGQIPTRRLTDGVAEPTWIIPAQVRESILAGSGVLQTV